MKRLGLWMVVLAALTLPAAGGCSRNPVTGARSFNLLTPQQEVSLGKEAAPQMVQESGGEYKDPVMATYVSEVGQRVAAPARNADYPYEYSFTVLDSDDVNAFALPGGPIFITRGLLFRMNSEAELAGVLAHEVTHVAAQHSAQQISRQLGAGVMLEIVGAVASGGGGSTTGGTTSGSSTSASSAEQIAKVVGTLLTLKYSRSQEAQADEYGMRFMVEAGYQPKGIVRVMEMFEKMEQQGGSSGPEFLKTHPNPENRVAALESEIKSEYPSAPTNTSLRVGTDTYQEKVLSRRSMQSQFTSRGK